MLVQLEGDERRETVQFWKDMTDIRNSAFEKKTEYDRSRDRANILGSVLPGPLEGEYDR